MKTLYTLLLTLLYSTTPALAATLSDGEIAKVLMTINKGEIDTAEIAEVKAQNSEVKSFAKTMVDQHKTNLKQTKDIVKKQDIEIDETALSKNAEKDAKALNKDLKKNEKGISFDAAYVSLQIKMHEKALATLNESLIPNAQNSELKTHLEKTKESVTAHLEHAKALHERLTSAE